MSRSRLYLSKVEITADGYSTSLGDDQFFYTYSSGGSVVPQIYQNTVLYIYYISQ